MPLFLAMHRDTYRFPIVPLPIMTKGLRTEGNEVNSRGRQSTRNNGVILLKANLETNLHSEGYKSLTQYTFANNIELRVETSKKNINLVNLLDSRVLYAIVRTIQNNFST